MNYQNWVVGDTPESCMPLGDQTAREHGLPESVTVVRARTAEEAITKSNKAYRKAIRDKQIEQQRLESIALVRAMIPERK